MGNIFYEQAVEMHSVWRPSDTPYPVEYMSETKLRHLKSRLFWVGSALGITSYLVLKQLFYRGK